MKYRAVIFDLDGTLADTLEDLAEATNCALSEFGRKTHPLNAYNKFVGNGITNMIKAALGGEQGRMLDNILDAMKREYRRIYLKNTKLYDGVADMVNRLKKLGVRIAILTNKDNDIACRIAAHFFADDFFEDVVGTTCSVPVKPGTKAVNSIIKNFGLDPSQVLFVGDSDVDMQTARSAGILAVGVSWGFRGKEELIRSGADRIIDKPAEILDFF